MVQIVQGKRKQSFGEQMSSGIGNVLNAGAELSQQYQQKQEQKLNKEKMDELGRQYGVDNLGSYPLELQKEIISNHLKGNREQEKYTYEERLKGQKSNQELEGNQNILRTLEKNRGLESGSLSGFESNPGLAEKSSRPQKEPNILQANKPMEAEQRKLMREISDTDEYKQASLVGKGALLIEGGMSKENADFKIRIENEEEKLKHAKGEAAERLKRDSHRESESYDSEILNASKHSQSILKATSDIEKALNSPNFNQYSLPSLFKGLGKIGNKIYQLLKTPEQGIIESNLPTLLEGFKELFKGKITDADLAFIEQKLPNISSSVEANLAIIGVMKKYARLDVLKGKIAAEIKKSNSGYRSLDYAQQVEDKYNDMTESVNMLDENGEDVQVDAYDVSNAINAGWRIKNE